MLRYPVWPAFLVTLTLVACGGKKEEPPTPQPALEQPAEPEPDNEPIKAEAKPEPKPEPEAKPTPEAKPEPEAKPTPAPDPEPVPTGESGFPTKVVDAPTTLVTATPGTVVKNPVPDSPEWLIQEVLRASMEPDEEKGWQMFLALLHEDQRIENALISRKTLNYPASRRKVKLFLYEDPNLPIYKVDRVVEESPKQVRIYVHNNSEGGMPTPCELRYDDNAKKWRVGICSL